MEVLEAEQHISDDTTLRLPWQTLHHNMAAYFKSPFGLAKRLKVRWSVWLRM